MVREYSDDLLKYIVQERDGKNFIKLLDIDIFDLAEDQIIFDLVQKYLDKYKAIPRLSNMLEFLDKSLKGAADVDDETYKVLEKSIRKMFVPLTADTTQLRESLKEYAQYRRIKNINIKYAPKFKEAKAKGESLKVNKQFLSELAAAVRIGEEDVEHNRGVLMFAGGGSTDYIEVEPVPLYLEAVNKMTTRGGFYKPQLIIILAPPKSFKTGFKMNLAKGLVRQGYKVYYADCENGKENIDMRFKQAMLECTYEDMKTKKYEGFWRKIQKQVLALGGEFLCEHYPANTKSMGDVSANLEYWKEQGVEFDCIIYDYLDLFKPEESKKQDKRLNIQDVYHDAVRLHNRWNMFGISQSQVNKKALSKRVFTIEDLAEDFGKAANAHACFAICRTPEEEVEGIARIVPVMQREGKKYKGGENFCLVRIDEEIQLVEEIEMSETLRQLKAKELADE